MITETRIIFQIMFNTEHRYDIWQLKGTQQRDGHERDTHSPDSHYLSIFWRWTTNMSAEFVCSWSEFIRPNRKFGGKIALREDNLILH